MEESETGRKWIKGGGWHNRLKKRNKKVKVGKSKKGASAEGQHSHIKNESEKGDKIKMVESERGERKYWNYQTEISQWKSESKSVKSKSENSVSKWKVKVVMGNVRSRGGAGIATGWKVKKCEEKYKRSNGRLWALSANTDSTLRVLSIRVPKDITPQPKRQSYQLK